MMKNIYKLVLIATAAVLSLVSCDLNLVPSTAIAYEEGGVLFTNSTDVSSFRNGIYASFRSVQRGKYYVNEEFMLDGFNAHIDFGNNFGGIHRTDYNFTTSDYDTRDFWSGNYGAIKNYNIVIANADNAAEDVLSSARLIKGEAFFFRAYSYLQLARHFGKAYNASSASSDLCVPLVLVYNQSEKPARATVKDVYSSIKSDLDSAAAIVKTAGEVRSQYVTVDAINALYARYYLDVADYTNAEASAKKVIDSEAGYALASTVKEMQAEYISDSGNETMMQLYASPTELPSSIPYYTYLGTTTETEEGFYLSPYYIPTKTLLSLYSETDRRDSCWFGNTVIATGDTLDLAIKVGGNYFYDIEAFLKYAGNPAYTSTNSQTGYNAAKPFFLGEMYLIAAEASLAAGNAPVAKTYLNTLQTARGAEATEATTETVRTEWRKETVGDGLRMSCMKRWGIGFSGRVPQDAAVDAAAYKEGESFEQKVFAADDYHFQWPVPSYEMKINKNLVQNAGY